MNAIAANLSGPTLDRRPSPPSPTPDAGGLEQDLYAGLVRYHNTDGAGNGSKEKGIQYPPDLASKTPDALDAYMKNLAHRLAQRPELEFHPSPAKGPERTAFRREVAARAADWVSKQAPDIIEQSVEEIKDPELASFARESVKVVPDEWHTAPSSSSGRYHPADEINQGGLVLHSARDAEVGDILSDLYGLDQGQKDIVHTALILHDSWKGGIPWKGYSDEHGDIGAQQLAKLVGNHDDKAQTVERLISHHMAQWNAPEMTEPTDVLEQIVSYADYLGSRDNVYVRVPGDSSSFGG